MKPPKDIKPEVLFRLLASRAAPSRKINHQLDFLKKFELVAVALPSHDVAVALDEGDVLELASRSIYCDGELAFRSSSELGLMGSMECDSIMEAWGEAFAVICPSIISADASHWKRALREGVEHPSNFSVVLAMSECCDVAVGSTLVRTPRPDRYYGMPVADLTDGQRMAFTAATNFVNEQIEAATKE